MYLKAAFSRLKTLINISFILLPSFVSSRLSFRLTAEITEN